MAFRVVLGLLTVFVLASPALAQDLTGTWRFRSVAGITNRGTICAAGSVSFNTTGAVTGGTFQECNAAVPAMPLTDGTLSVDANGNLAGTIGTFGIQGNFLAAGDAFVAVSSVNESNPVGFGMALFVKVTTTTYAQTDLTGTWRVHLLRGGELPTELTEEGFGTIDVSATGALTGGALDLFSGAEGSSVVTIVGGTLAMDPEGVITGPVISTEGGRNTSTVFTGIMATDRKLVAGAVRSGNENVGSGLTLLQREPTADYAPTDIAGQWTLNHLILDAFRSDESTSLRGTLDIDAGGAITGTLHDGFGEPVPIIGAAIVGPLGSVELVLSSVSRNLVFAINGTMFDTKLHIIGSDIIFFLESSEPGTPIESFGVGLLSMVKRETVQFTQPIFTVKENVATASIAVSRTGTLTGPVTVTYTATPLTAVPNADFKTVAGVLTFPANVGGTKTFPVPILNNPLVDGNRSVMLALGVPTGNAVRGAQSTATLIIQDDDLPGTFKLDKTAYTVAENAGFVTITVMRSGTNLAGNVSVTLTATSGTATSGTAISGVNYTAPAGALTFAAGETVKPVKIPITPDHVVTGPLVFNVALANPSSGATLDPNLSSALVTIKDVDVGGQVKFAPATYSVNEGAGQVKLTVVRTGGTAGGVLVDFATVDGAAVGGHYGGGDFNINAGTLTFNAGTTSATITIDISQDTLVEGNETFQVQLSNPRSVACVACNSATLVPPTAATVTIVDDDSAVQFSARTFTVTEGTANGVINILRTGALVGTATVAYSATRDTEVAGGDFTPVSGVLTFPANTPSKTFNVPIVNNALLDGNNRSVMLKLANPTGAQLGPFDTATLTILDNDQAGQFKLDKTAYTVAENAGFVSITVMRTGTNLVGNVSVTLTATDSSAISGVNYTAPAGALTFAAGETAKTVKIPITPDHVVTGPLVFNVNVALANPSSGATLGTPKTAPVTITNTDLGGQISFAPATYLVAESAGSVTLVVRRTGGLAGNVSVGFTTDVIVPASPNRATSDDFTAVKGRLTFGFGNTSATIVVPIMRDDGIEPTESFQVKLFDAQGGATLPGPSVATVTIADLDPVVQFSGKFLGNFPQVVRTGSLATPVTVGYVATDGSAVAGSDYVLAEGTLTFKPNVAVQYIPLTIIGDNIAEGSETFTIALRNPSAPARLGPASVREFMIADNDFGGTVGFEATLYSVIEGGTVDVAIVRTGGAGTVLTVQWQAGPGSATPGVDFTPASGSVTFSPNERRKTFTISALTDAIAEEGESVDLTLSVPVGAATLGRAKTTLSIRDAPPVVEEGSRRAP